MENVAKHSQKFLSHSLNLKIHPRLANLGERRQLLAKLKEFGDVLVFKSLFVSGYALSKCHKGEADDTRSTIDPSMPQILPWSSSGISKRLTG